MESMPGESITEWLGRRKADSKQRCEPVSWAQAKSWKVADGVLRHRQNRFFSMVGIQATSNIKGVDGTQQVMIDQPEIGILGFLMGRHQDQKFLLVQAKAEPGNVGDVQIAPTVQATVSNYSRAHGGLPTAYLDRFLNPEGAVVSDSLQSEQGHCFLRKYNRNMVGKSDGNHIEPISDSWRWYPVRTVLDLLNRDFLVNTDARSVLVSTNWHELCDSGRPFADRAGSDAFSKKLHDSFFSGEDYTQTSLSEIRQSLQVGRLKTHVSLAFKPIQELRACRVDETTITDGESGATIKPYAVEVQNREVPCWDQPLIHFPEVEEVSLACQVRHGILCFLLRKSVEVGFAERVQFGPSLQSRPGRHRAGSGEAEQELHQWIHSWPQARQHVQCLQSEEGGRFYRSITRYRVVEIGENVELPSSGFYCWLTLAQIHLLLKETGMVTNEARSAISLLLSYL